MKINRVVVGFFLCLVAAISHAAAFESKLISVTTGAEQGTESDVVFIHGFASTSEVWSEAQTYLGNKHRIHFIDINGFANRPAPDTSPQSYLTALRDEIIRYIHSQQLDKPTLVGHSMGGLISLLIGSSNQSVAGKIVVVDALPFYSLIFNPNATTEQVAPMAANMEQQLLAMNDAQFEFQAKRSVSILTKAAGKPELLLDWSKTSNRQIYAQLIREVMAYDSRESIAAIESPVFVIYAFDQNMPFSLLQLRKLYDSAYTNVGNVEFMRVEDSFHFVMWDQTETFYNHLNQALEQQVQ
ncbi:alpha/beta hydrolase [Maricurvus nonylphenolicus]|uniref:alpha/beta fold hydrolase n=1 Tax=Maricurvus nonylphenolicus TaxID=1008307 RepID=UPI0036F401B0